MRNRRIQACFILVGITALLNYHSSFADVKLPAIFGTNMVLQQKMKIAIWGWANPGEKVLVAFMGRTFKTISGSNGKWSLKIDKYTAGGPYIMTIKGKENKLVFRNILIGDVWVASGQSNMEFGIQREVHAASTIPKSANPMIHFFFVPYGRSLQPQDDIAPSSIDSLNGKWVVCSPTVMGNPKWAMRGFSAVGYYFAQEIQHSVKFPIGMIGAYNTGTAAQAWMSLKALSEKPAFYDYVTAQQHLRDHYSEAKAAYPRQLENYQKAITQWNEEIGKDYENKVKQWETLVAKAKANGNAAPEHPKLSKPMPEPPLPPEGDYNSPSNLFNAMIHPILHYKIKGIIWYQGESNGSYLPAAIEYKELFPRLIKDWRNNWGEGDFPFLFVQLPNYRALASTPSEGNWPWVREGQLKAIALPQTEMATIIDLGEAANLHPADKIYVGHRLALVARNVVYHEPVIYAGPRYQSSTVVGNNIVITFDKNRPLAIGNGKEKNGTELKGFGIAGADQKFYWAKATIKGNTVVVNSDRVANPVAVRYDWADNPPGNLYNNAGLPASPFRTDNWWLDLSAGH